MVWLDEWQRSGIEGAAGGTAAGAAALLVLGHIQAGAESGPWDDVTGCGTCTPLHLKRHPAPS